MWHSLAECMAEKFGYENVEELKKDGKSRFSLVENGILDKPCARLLLANVSFHILPEALTQEANHRWGRARTTRSSPSRIQ